MQIIAFGHSITQGRLDLEGGWVERLKSEMYRETIENEDLDYDVLNLGIPGNDSGQIVDRFVDELERRRWEDMDLLLLFQVGANDIQYLLDEESIRVTEQEFEENIRNLIDLARDYTSRIAFVGDPPADPDITRIPWAPEKEISNQRLEDYREILIKVCNEEDIPFVDIYTEFRNREDYLELLEDGIHPNTQGHEEIYRLLKKELQEENLL